MSTLKNGWMETTYFGETTNNREDDIMAMLCHKKRHNEIPRNVVSWLLWNGAGLELMRTPLIAKFHRSKITALSRKIMHVLFHVEFIDEP